MDSEDSKDKFFILHPDKKVVCMDFGKLHYTKQLKCTNNQPVYPVHSFDEQPVCITTHKEQFFVMFATNKIRAYPKDFKEILFEVDFYQGDYLHFNKGLLHLVRAPHAGEVNKVDIFKQVGVKWQPHLATQTEGKNNELPNEVSLYGNFIVQASPSSTVKIFQIVYAVNEPIKQWFLATGSLNKAMQTFKQNLERPGIAFIKLN